MGLHEHDRPTGYRVLNSGFELLITYCVERELFQLTANNRLRRVLLIQTKTMAALGDELNDTISPASKQPIGSSKMEEIATNVGILSLISSSNHFIDVESGMRFGSPIRYRI